jgi:hypothetical protein
MAAPLNTCNTIEQRGFVRFFVGKKYFSKGYPQRNAAHMGMGNISSGDSLTHLIQKLRSQLGIVAYLLNYLRNSGLLKSWDFFRP